MKTKVILLTLAMVSICMGALEPIHLDGEWRFRTDPDDHGEAQEWFRQKLPEAVQLPGTMAQNQKGAINDDRDFTMHLSSRYLYQGSAWYQRDIVIPPEWADQQITLHLERSKLTSVWVNDTFLGSNDSLGCEQVYTLSGKVKPGQHTLTIRVDNKTRPGASGGHQITNSTQTNWNGIIGQISLRANPPVWIQGVLAYPDTEQKLVNVKLTLGNRTGASVQGSITMDAHCKNGSLSHDVSSVTHVFSSGQDNQTLEYVYPLGEQALEWDEFEPNLYTLNVTLDTGAHRSTRTIQFGLRQFETDGTQFVINGKTTFLRGKHDALVWPLLGHPSMDVDAWMRVFKIAKSHGINHYRFHSCTPPEAAFLAADRLGVYLQTELYHFGTNLNKQPGATEYSLKESLRILETYGNHPSFVMFTLGNEMRESREIRAELVRKLRAFDGTRLYAQASNYDFRELQLAPDDDFWVTARTMSSGDGAVRGSFSHADLPLGHIQSTTPSTRHDYAKALQQSPVPVIGHESGQFQVFPNFDEIRKYTGVQQPWNLETFAQRLKAAGMYDQWPDFFRASGALAVICYREEIETALRTRGFGGFQLLDLQDFPGQGTALVGILDAFMDSKGLITPENWRQFCSEVVPLMRMDTFIYQSGEPFEALLQIANYGPGDIRHGTLQARVVDARGETLHTQKWQLSASPARQGEVSDIGHLNFNMPEVARAKKLSVEIQLSGTAYRNHYPLWLYPKDNQAQVPDTVHVQRKLDVQTMQLLSQGESVLLFPAQDQMPNSIEGFFASDFWCYPMFRNITKWRNMESAPGTLGILCDPKHPALSKFPTDSHSNWQWYRLIMNSRSIILDQTPQSYRPIIQVIDNFERNHKLGLIFECTVGRGKLLVCSIDLPQLQHLPEARQLYSSLCHYMQSDSFAPPAALPAQLVANLFRDQSDDNQAEGRIDFSQFFNGGKEQPKE